MNKIILICDDDEAIADAAKIILTEKGYKVRIVSTGELVLASVKKERPALILLDLWMPTIGGKKITQMLKENNETKDIPVVIVSANRDTAKIAQEAGADAHLAKPFDIWELEGIAEKYAKSG